MVGTQQKVTGGINPVLSMHLSSTKNLVDMIEVTSEAQCAGSHFVGCRWYEPAEEDGLISAPAPLSCLFILGTI